MKYRPDIDGLRALAVLMVVLYHVGFGLMSGGFVGVDIFFVISGYLITSIIFRYLQDNTFKILEFYSRRIRRILPAFFTVTFVCLLAAYFIYLSADYEEVSASVNAATLFTSNIFFWKTSFSYFSGNLDEMPFLHTWSLSLEEQFYFLWPVFLMITYRWLPRIYFVSLIFIFMVASFAFGEWGARNIPNASYYLLPTRCGELLLGALLVFLPDLKGRYNKVILHTLSGIGLLLLTIPAFVLTDRSLFPGLNALWPCLGAALMIYTGRTIGTVGAKLLSVKPMIWIGLISYSLYLWHFPLLAFSRYLRIEITPQYATAIIATSILLSYLTWRYIEQPCRKRGQLPFRKISFYYYVLPALTILLMCQINNPRNNIKLAKPFERALLNNGWCHASNGNKDNNRKFNQAYLNCFKGDRTEKVRKAILFGDSTAGHYEPFVDQIAQAYNFSLQPVSTNSCYPTLEIKETGLNGALCAQFREFFVKSVEQKKYDYIFLSNRWIRTLTMETSKLEELDAVVRFASQNAKSVFLLQQSPEFSRDMAKCYKIRKIIEFTSCEAKSSASFYQANQFLDKFSQQYSNIFIIRTEKFFDCDDQGHCSAFDSEGNLLYVDTGHLNIKASQSMASWYLDSSENNNFAKRLN